MREIKFRAWDIDKKRMIYLATNHQNSLTHLQMNNHSWGVFEPDKEDYYGGCTCNSNMGDILMQYTGRKDKNGKEIYNGDIVIKTDTNACGWCRVRTCTVSWDKYGYWMLTTTYGDGYALANFDCEQLEVIGNIYENSNLLKESETE